MSRIRTIVTGSFVVVSVLALLAYVPAANATGVRPAVQPGTEALTWLPPADDFGDGWSQLDPTAIELPDDVFRENAIGIYLGPAGARVFVGVFLTVEGRVAIRQSWDEIGGIFELYGWSLAPDQSVEEAISEASLPTGCVEGRRVAGQIKEFGNIVTGIPGAATLCAVDPDVLILTAASGQVFDLQGWQAADAAVQRSLIAGTGV